LVSNRVWLWRIWEGIKLFKRLTSLVFLFLLIPSLALATSHPIDTNSFNDTNSSNDLTLSEQFQQFQNLVPPADLIPLVMAYLVGIFQILRGSILLVILFFIVVVGINHFFTQSVFAMVPGHFQYIITLVFVATIFAFVIPMILDILGIGG